MSIEFIGKARESFSARAGACAPHLGKANFLC